MKLQKTIASIALISLLPVYSAFAALDVSQFDRLISALQKTVGDYAETIRNLQDENAKLKKVIESYMALTKQPSPTTSAIPVVSGTAAPVAATIPPIPVTPSKASAVDKYNKIIDKINSSAQDIYSKNNVDVGSSIGLFEFIEPSNFFISIDDRKNPAGQYAFKKKMLYSYDNDLNLRIDGVFDLDYASGYYKTLQGSNPFAKATRIRVKNPAYNGTLMTPDSPSSTSATTAAPTTTANASAKTTTPVQTTGTPKNVTLDSIKTAYNKNNILEALKLSTEYIKTDSNNLEVAKIRYRSFYILGKYADSLAEVQKIEALIGLDKMEKVVACDAKTIAKLAKNADLNKKYSDACSRK